MSETSRMTVVITGVSRGLGRAMAEGFLTAGWTVVGCCRKAEAAAALQAEHGDSHYFAAVDVTDEAKVAAFCGEVLQRYGAPHLLLNNAAIINENAPLWEVPADQFEAVIDVNIKGVANMIRHLAPAMLAAERGVIVNFSSGWGRSTSPDVAPYCASKYAIEGLSQAMAQDTGGRVAVVALNPGIIDTDMLRSTFQEGAGAYPTAERWARTAVPFLIKLGPRDNGKALTAP